jgi:hypothetical protein
VLCCFVFHSSPGVGISAFLDMSNNSILRAEKPSASHSGPYGMSGSIVKRKGKKKKADLMEEDNEVDEQDGEAEPSRSHRFLADQGMDDSGKFQSILRQAIRDAQAAHPGKIVVVIVDGGGPHTSEPVTSLRPSNMTASEIVCELQKAGLWSNGMSVKDAKKNYTASPIPRSQWTTAELIALDEGAIVIFLPLAHPFLNVIEQVRRDFDFCSFFSNLSFSRCGEL